jgi:hypothetical protein
MLLSLTCPMGVFVTAVVFPMRMNPEPFWVVKS